MPETDRPIASLMRPGDILAGKYRIERVLGSGGMGMVVAARHLQLEEQVAIKFLLPTALEMPDAVERFMREAKAAVRIRSDHVVRVYDVGTLEEGAPYMVMEYLRGTDLSKWLQRHESVSVADAVELMLQVLEAVADAHAVGIIHRDLKPSNLFCVHRQDGLPFIKVLDFGISKLTDSSRSQLTMTAPAAVMGSPLYMSPEQMRSARDVDTRTDIWAIGIILYEMLTGVAPFDGATLSEVCVRAATLPPPSIRERCPTLPEELEAVVLRCLKKDPNERYNDVAELAAALLPFASKQVEPALDRVSRITSTLGGVSTVRGTLRSSDHVVSAGSMPSGSNWQRKSPHKNSIGRVSRIGAGIAIGTSVICASLLLFVRFGTSESTTNVAAVAPANREVLVTNAPARPEPGANTGVASPVVLPVGALTAQAMTPNTPSVNTMLSHPTPSVTKSTRESQGTLLPLSAKPVAAASPSNVPESRPRPPLDESQRSSAPRDLFAGPQ